MNSSSLLCIDLGSSYTKVGMRSGWNERSKLLQDETVQADWNFCMPSAVASVYKNGRVTWLTGDEAFSQRPGEGIHVYQNWKKDVFPLDRPKADAEHLIVAYQYFCGMRERLPKVGTPKALLQAPCRLSIPKLNLSEAQGAELVKIAELAGFQMATDRPFVFEPEANACGVFTRARNAAWQPEGTPTLCPNYLQMFDPDEKEGIYRSYTRKLWMS
jgi:hypothetical protein